MPILDFKGKQVVYAHHMTVPYRTLDVVRSKSVLPKGRDAREGNLIVHGDNLHALKALMPRYAGRVNCIYIDPPYNTGNEGWCYNDNVNSDLMKRWLKENGAVDGDDEERHEKWLCMMWPRLQLLRELLAEDGVIFISIDDNEQHRLRMLMDEIFGESPEGRSWVTSQKTMKRWIKENRVFFGKSGKGAPQLKRYLSEVQQGVVPLTIWTHEEAGHTDGARKLLKEIFHDEKLPFDNPKPVNLIKRVCQIAAGKDAIILDSFAGSGTTAHAVLELNKEDEGNRKFILVECEDYAHTVTAKRVRRVIKGVSSAKNENLKEGLGGTFAFCELGRELNIENMLRGKNLPDYDVLARHVAYTATGATMDKIRPGKDHYFGETPDYRLHMIYRPDLKFLRSKESALTELVAERIGKAARNKNKTALVFAPWKFISQKDLSKEGVTFCQLPYAIHQMFGFGD